MIFTLASGLFKTGASTDLKDCGESFVSFGFAFRFRKLGLSNCVSRLFLRVFGQSVGMATFLTCTYKDHNY